ncbi:MAG: NADH-quinone oxidoreductase subunit L [Chromatiales bacterium]|nr:NADH-quinone oxidoreductase subunit L [Chromatiales bacterium]
MIEKLIIVVPVMPLVSALLTHLLSGTLGRGVARISVSAAGLTFFAASALLWMAVSGEPAQQATLTGATGSWGTLLFDPLAALMAMVVSGISLLVHMYSVRYMAEESGYGRFFVLLDLMTAALLIMVAAGDLITLLVVWHLIGVLLYFLLGQDTRSQSAYRYALWTLFTYRIGDLPLVLAAGLLYHAFGTWSLTLIFAGISANPEMQTLFGLPLVEVVASLIALSAFARSAQIFLHTWLPYTMGGPTPVSALMHAGIVNAGGFLINRFAPVFVHTGDVLHWVFLVGLITAVIGSVLMLAQNDIKKSLGYSTMGQMGFMIMECGVGAFSLAVYHLIAHGLFKGTLFLSAGGVINAARKDDGVPKDDLYTFVVERRPARQRKPWLVMAFLTLAVPAIILIIAHWLVSQDYFQQQGAIVLLFFGWVTGAQLVFSTYRMRTENPLRLITLILFSFTVVVLGYTVISHAFDVFLYPDPAFRSQIYAAAGIDLVWFDVLVGLITVIVAAGWIKTYYAERQGRRTHKHRAGIWARFYATIHREFYLGEVYAQASRRLLDTANRLNVLLRWS